jgi:hypothetical protein
MQSYVSYATLYKIYNHDCISIIATDVLQIIELGNN